MRAMCALCCCLLFLTASASSSSSTKLDSTRAFHQVASHPSVPTRPTINHRAVNTPVKPSTPLPDLRPAVQELKNFYTTSLSSKRSSLTWEDLEALHEKFKLAVMRNKQARDQQKNPGAFGMEGCPYNSPQAALHFTETIQGSTPVAYLSTPCLSTDSFGNFMANYLEGRMCANFTGLHYVATNKAWEIPGLRWSDHNTVNIHDFLGPLPNIVPKNYGVETLPLSQIRQQCHCPNLCHIDDKSFIARYPEAVQEILSPMYTNHLPKMNNILMNETFRHSLPRNTSNDYVDYFPPIPDVAIHYRCGDNIHSSGMGLMRFTTLKKLIPSSANYVYVMSEHEVRKTKGSEIGFCTGILKHLHTYLSDNFPEKTIVTLRGAKVFDDVTRFALSPVLVASLSSFSLFAAITNKNKAYYPAYPPHKNGLFRNHQPYLGSAFTWLKPHDLVTSDSLMRMGLHEASVPHVVQCLKSDTAC